MLPKVLQLLKSPRAVMSVLTLVVLAIIIFLSRHELVKAWNLFLHADLWLLFLLLPFQIIVYFAGGEMIFSYLREKNLIHHISRLEQTRIALELNLVNHIFPSGGVSGISYTTWRMHGKVNRYIVAASFLLIIVVLALTFGLIFVFSSKRRMQMAAAKLSKFINTLVKIVTLGKKRRVMKSKKVEEFFVDMQDDFQDLSNHPKLLIKPMIWGTVYTVFDVAMFAVAFLSLGVFVNPAILMVGYGVAGLAAIVVFTPGGTGVYETIMIIFLSMAGTPPDLAIAGIILTRAILLTGTIIFGYIFYQHALIKYGKPDDSQV